MQNVLTWYRCRISLAPYTNGRGRDLCLPLRKEMLMARRSTYMTQQSAQQPPHLPHCRDRMVNTSMLRGLTSPQDQSRTAMWQKRPRRSTGYDIALHLRMPSTSRLISYLKAVSLHELAAFTPLSMSSECPSRLIHHTYPVIPCFTCCCP